jgi:hypothetical protein
MTLRTIIIGFIAIAAATFGDFVPLIVEGSVGPERGSDYAAIPLRATDDAVSWPAACAFLLPQRSFTLASSIHN